MRIERISDTQMKFVLRHTDLEARDIKISELSHSSDKTQELFREMLQIAQEEGAFESSETAPYLIEATREGEDSLAVVVTKMNADDLEKHFSLVPAAKGRCRFKRNEFIDQPDYPNEDSQSVIAFNNFDMAAMAADGINLIFTGKSQLYKFNGQFFLWLQNETEDDRSTNELEAIMLEFGQKHVANLLSRHYLAEHGETIIMEDAVSKLANYVQVN